MSARMQRLLRAIKGRAAHSGKGGEITTAGSFVRVVRSCIEDRRFWKYLNLGSELQWKRALREADRKLVWFDPGQKGFAGGCRKGAEENSGVVVQFGQSKRAEAQKLTPGAVMDFECVLTSRSKDRDRDVLHPDGADIDTRMPLLWQHIPMEPCGKLLAVLSQDKDAVNTAFSIIDSPLGRDAAQLAEFGALRISHGFQPLRFHALEDEDEQQSGDMFAGWEIEKYKVMEGSLVSIPSNEDAVITAYSREKLHHPLVKEWGRSLFDGRSTQVTHPGFPGTASGTFNFNVHLNGTGVNGAGSGTKQADLSESVTRLIARYQTGLVNQKSRKTALLDEAGKAALASAVTAKVKGLLADGLERDEALALAWSLCEPRQKADELEPVGTEGAGESAGEDAGDSGEEAAKVTMANITDAITEAAGVADLPQEAADRLAVITGMLGTLKDNLDSHTEAVSEAANNQDLAGLFAGMQDMVEGIMSQLSKLCDELDTIMLLEGMPEGAVSALQVAYDGIETIRDEMSEMASSAQAVDDQAAESEAGEGDEESEMPEEEGELVTEEFGDEEDGEDDEESKEGDADTDEEEELESKESEDDEDDEEMDDKEVDEDDEEEKEALASDDDNDESMEDPTPDDDTREGKSGGKAPKTCDRIGWRLLGSLAAGKSLDPQLIDDLIAALEERQAKNIERALARV